MLWQLEAEEITPSVIRYTLLESGLVLSNRRVIEHWIDSSEFCEFCAFFCELLYNAPFNCYRWETSPQTRNMQDTKFEFVLIDNPLLDVPASSKDFAEHFSQQPLSGIVEFNNLGHDAMLVVPCPVPTPTNYAHLAAFVRSAPEQQQHQLWRQVGLAMQNRLSDKPVWLNTAGGGVPWLHIRLDDYPKYYAYSDYKTFGQVLG